MARRMAQCAADMVMVHGRRGHSAWCSNGGGPTLGAARAAAWYAAPHRLAAAQHGPWPACGAARCDWRTFPTC
ncbi:hypothetical protein E2562_000173 [Oryza meyeriana var. granulata]|uniref:Uncharacterized protein n=1 Tax=Oryza meyeriana var. granulata TaxID=110450 RepID=A0A6G1DBQ2_9ORYZ|nr:hypothetical protein E2562_000173 [Oryza meyeriana var. granulata]